MGLHGDSPLVWWSQETVAVVTGGNKGIGLEMVRHLGKEGLTVVLTARDSTKGLGTVHALKAEGIESVAFHPLEVTSSESVQKFASWLREEFGGVDILINNAGIHYYSENYEDAVETLDTNYFGVKRVTKALIPLMRASVSGARIINVSSQAASLEYSEGSSLKEKLTNVEFFCTTMLDNLAIRYLNSVKAGQWRNVPEGEAAMNNFQYIESKLLLNAYTQILARTLAFRQSEKHKIFVNAISPCCVQTDMEALVRRKPTEVGHDILYDVFGGHTTTSVEDGADTAVWLALLPRDDYPNGKFFAERREISF